MEEKQVVPARDDKEVIPLAYRDKQIAASSQKEAICSHSDKEAISTVEKEAVILENGLSRLPVIKSHDFFHITNDDKEIRDHSTNETIFNVSREVKKNLIRSNEHQITIFQPSQVTCVATAKVLTKNREIKIANSADGSWQCLQSHESCPSFAAGNCRLSWQPAAAGTAFGQFKLVDHENTQRPLALWKTSNSKPGQTAAIDYFESMPDPDVQTLSLATILAVQESHLIAANRDDDKGGSSRKFNGVDPGNSMGMGGVGGGGMM